MLTSKIFITHHVKVPISALGLTAAAPCTALFSEGGDVQMEKHTALADSHPKLILRSPAHGIQTSVLDSCQPAVTLAVLAFPRSPLTPGHYEMLKIVSLKAKRA